MKQIHALSLKKHRDASGLFLAEGEKIVAELASAGYRFQLIVGTEEKMAAFRSIDAEKSTCTPEEIKKISLLKTPQSLLAICYQKKLPFNELWLSEEPVPVLERIQDPGNLGTIIRLASWFGLRQIVCSPDSADCYNPKVVQASMGALAHVSVFYTDLIPFLSEKKEQGIPIYGTFLEGENIYGSSLTSKGMIVFGNEGKGISQETEKLIDRKLMIPSHATGRLSVESLNVSVAAAIVCSEFRRNALK